MSFAKELLQSATEALEIAEGKREAPKVYVPEAVDVAAIRKAQGLSQTGFAERYGLPVATIRDWEQHRRTPDHAARVLLSVITHEPDAVGRALTAAE